jgi:hypothetical protein
VGPEPSISIPATHQIRRNPALGTNSPSPELPPIPPPTSEATTGRPTEAGARRAGHREKSAVGGADRARRCRAEGADGRVRPDHRPRATTSVGLANLVASCGCNASRRPPDPPAAATAMHRGTKPEPDDPPPRTPLRPPRSTSRKRPLDGGVRIRSARRNSPAVVAPPSPAFAPLRSALRGSPPPSRVRASRRSAHLALVDSVGAADLAKRGVHAVSGACVATAKPGSAP